MAAVVQGQQQPGVSEGLAVREEPVRGEPVREGLHRGPEARRGIVYCSAGLALAAYADLLAELGLDVRDLEPPAFVDIKSPRVYLLGEDALDNPRLLHAVEDLHGDLAAAIVVTQAARQHDIPAWAFAYLEAPAHLSELRFALLSALRQIGLHERARKAQVDLDRRATQIADLHHVGVALSAVHDVDALQSLILTKARAITSADAGSLYLVVEEEQPVLDANGEPLFDMDDQAITTRVKMLAFNKAENHSNPSDFKAFKMPINAGIAGHVATTGAIVQHDDIYDLPPDVPYAFNRAFDQQTGYRSKSMLAVPMLNSDQEIIGVIQLINRKYRGDVTLSASNIEREVLPFSLEDRDLTLSFASQAAVALDNKRLIDNIQTLFEGFVHASVQAIESRDPTTSGHSGRVATLTVGLAEALNTLQLSEFDGLHFEEGDIKEIRYASVLHDFGKVGVREQVLVKSKKLYDWQVEQIRGRFGVARAALEAKFLRRKLDYMLAHGPDLEAMKKLDKQFEAELAELEASFQLVRQVNEPAVLATDTETQLQELGGLTYPGLSGDAPLVEPAELRKLSIKKGSLDDGERLEIESHVTHTYKFLTKIPWTRELRRVPEIAWAHHEKLDGTGYPNRLTADQIPVQSKMMTISDIYDALTAWDRPYKKAVPVDKALQILQWEANDGHVDPKLLEVFIDQGVYKLVAR
ncbi:MAG: GAF domain-containing protein [Chloroflexi bacterium]|nr:GAF domain-containing protein [Chloroflexota bacterium]